ncbi:metallophosphoesterase [uncultured Sphaerotilus sp.]|uniref:metallophosphoesterase family protein n=1 Tax=uncultured Sphaerotilus sp. TaxID=474984 RepID=UPI0030CA3CDF
MSKYKFIQISDLHFSRIKNFTSFIEVAKEKDAPHLIDKLVFEDFKRNFITKWGKKLIYPSTFDSDVAIALLSRLHGIINNFDVLVITGDIASTGDDDDLRIAREYFDGKIPKNWTKAKNNFHSLFKHGVPIITVPGNHDRYHDFLLNPGFGPYERFFGMAWDFDKKVSNYDDGCKNKFYVKYSILEKLDSCLIFVAGDFSLRHQIYAEGFLGHIGQGRVDSVLQGMVSVTNKIRSNIINEGYKKYAVVWMVHFPPCFPGVDSGLKLINDYDLLNAVKNTNIKLLLAGHTHEPLWYRCPIHGDAHIFSCGTTSGVDVNNSNYYSEFYINVTGPDEYEFNAECYELSVDAKNKKIEFSVMQDFPAARKNKSFNFSIANAVANINNGPSSDILKS